MNRRHIAFVFGVLCLLPFLFPEAEAQTVTIDMDSTYQAIRGFGGIHITSWQQDRDLNEDMRKKAFDNMPGEMGLSILRLQINPDSNQFYRELAIAQYAVEKGAIVFASPWDPPAVMLDPESAQPRLLEEYYDDYADHLNRYYTFMNDSGVPIYAISVQNEPDWPGGWTQWTSGEMIKFLEENAQTIQTRVIAPESYQFRRPYTDALLNDPEANDNFDIVGGHIYGAGLFDYPLAREKGKEVWMTEHYTSSDRSANLWPDALLVGNEITDCMQANFNAYVWWYIRRFYGLITDDGSISKRGYVFSHFSKFVRPGAERVDVGISSAPGIDATAFKTDSSLVIVVVNSNETATELNFEIQNGTVDTLTRFTTSAAKNVTNEGGISVTGDPFSVTVDAYSITTLTSWAGNGGKFGNISPVADAGEDIIVDDLDGNGMENIILNGRGSSDPDGTITNYSWSSDGLQFGWSDSLQIAVLIGEYQVILTVTDEDGATDSDTLNIIVNGIYNTELWFESECSQVGSTWELHSDATASHGEYIATPAGTELVESPSDDTADQLIITFEVEEESLYKVWGRVITPSANDDSFWVRMDEGSWAMWNNIPSGTTWHWDDVHDGGADNNIVYDLSAGEHTLTICYREDGALLDKILISNTGVVPSGIGGTDETCPEDTTNVLLNSYSDAGIILYPNPAQETVSISWNKGFSSLLVVSLDGRKMLQEEYLCLLHHTELDLDLEKGLYFLILSNEKSTGIHKFMVD